MSHDSNLLTRRRRSERGFGHGASFEVMVLFLIFGVALVVIRVVGVSAGWSLVGALAAALVLPINVLIIEAVRRVRERRDGRK